MSGRDSTCIEKCLGWIRELLNNLINLTTATFMHSFFTRTHTHTHTYMELFACVSGDDRIPVVDKTVIRIHVLQ